MRIPVNHNGFTLLELLMAVGFSALLMTGVFSFYNSARQVYSSGITAQNLQDGADIVISKIIQGKTEYNGTVYRLATSTSYMIPNGVGSALYKCGGNAQATPCNSSNIYSEIYFCQDSPCTYNDATARWYYLNSTATSVIYHHPASSNTTVEEVIYTAPAGSALILRFVPPPAPPAPSVYNPSVVVEADVALSEILSAKITNQRLAASGSASTYLLLRNHP